MDIGFPGAVFNRLMVIAAEDVGLADPTLVEYECECLEIFENLIKQYAIKKRDAIYFPDICKLVDRAVIAAAISYKSRLLPMLSFATLYDIYVKENFNDNVYEYFNLFVDSLDKNDEKYAIYYAHIAGIYFNQMDRLLTTIKRQSERQKEYLIHKWIDGYKRHNELLMLAGSVVLLCREIHYNHGEYKNVIKKYSSIPIKATKIPDRAYDKHTSVGKRKGRGLKHFFNKAASLKNERFPSDWEITGRKAYFLADHKGLGKAAKVIDATKKKLRAPVALETI